MKEIKALRPLLNKGMYDHAAIVGAPERFDFAKSLKVATEIKVAIAFGHMSGWKLIADSIKHSKAKSVKFLLGTAFFRTEPDLLVRLMRLSKSFPAIEVYLASPGIMFHPKVWILKSANGSFGVVGSGNLSGGGLVGNVECSIYTEKPTEIQALSEWFDHHWRFASELDAALDTYRRKYAEIKKRRRLLDSEVNSSMKEFSQYVHDREARLQLSSTITAAKKYWLSNVGKSQLAERQIDLRRMRQTLKFPEFNFDESAWKDFIKIKGFGWIRDGRNENIIKRLPNIKAALKLSLTDVYAGLDALIAINGIGPNIATKLLVVCNSEEFIVFNSRVKAALESLQIPVREFHKLDSNKYRKLMKYAEPIWKASDALGLDRASALDAFFFKLSNRSR